MPRGVAPPPGLLTSYALIITFVVTYSSINHVY
jgi:hypothetical protein